MILLYMYQIFSSLRGHFHFFVHFFFTFMEHFFLDTPYLVAHIHWMRRSINDDSDKKKISMNQKRMCHLLVLQFKMNVSFTVHQSKKTFICSLLPFATIHSQYSNHSSIRPPPPPSTPTTALTIPTQSPSKRAHHLLT